MHEMEMGSRRNMTRDFSSTSSLLPNDEKKVFVHSLVDVHSFNDALDGTVLASKTPFKSHN